MKKTNDLFIILRNCYIVMCQHTKLSLFQLLGKTVLTGIAVIVLVLCFLEEMVLLNLKYLKNLKINHAVSTKAAAILIT